MKLFNSLILLSLLPAMETFAQTPADQYRKRMIDSIKKVYITEAAIRNPLLRQVSVSTDIISRGNIHSKLYGNESFDGKISQVRTTALVNVPLKSWKKDKIFTTFSFFHQYADVNQITTHADDAAIPQRGYENKLTVGLTTSYQHIDSLFGHIVIYNGSLSLLTGDASSIQKVSFLGGAILLLKQTPVTSVSAGVWLNIDPSIDVPVLPLFVYWHQFKNNMEINVNLPRSIEWRTRLSKNSWFTFGTYISAYTAFFQGDQPAIPRDISYSTIDLKTGPGLEFRMGKFFMLGLNGGVITPVMARMFERNKSSSDYFVRNKINTTPFANVTLSLLPF